MSVLAEIRKPKEAGCKPVLQSEMKSEDRKPRAESLLSNDVRTFGLLVERDGAKRLTVTEPLSWKAGGDYE